MLTFPALYFNIDRVAMNSFVLAKGACRMISKLGYLHDAKISTRKTILLLKSRNSSDVLYMFCITASALRFRLLSKSVVFLVLLFESYRQPNSETICGVRRARTKLVTVAPSQYLLPSTVQRWNRYR